MKSLVAVLVVAFGVAGLIKSNSIYPCPTFGLMRIPHSSSCQHFVQCFAGEPVVQRCGPGLEYNDPEQRCMESAEANCSRVECPLFNDPDEMVYFPDYLECDKYYLCHNGEQEPFRCAEGMHWSTAENWCTTPALADCQLYEIECPQTGTVLRPHPLNCQRYYYCIEGYSFPGICPDGLLFDMNEEQCNSALIAECYSDSVSP